MKNRALKIVALAIFSLAILPAVAAVKIRLNLPVTSESGNAANSQPIVRFNSNATEEVAAELNSAFDAARSVFQKSIEENFLLESLFQKQRLDANALASERFTRVVDSFKNRNASFPLSRKLAEVWATGESDEPWRRKWSEHLRAAMSRPILPAPLPDAENPSGHALLVSVTNLAEKVQPENVATSHAKEVLATELYTLSKARRELQLLFSDEKQVANYLGLFLKPNCAYEAKLPPTIATPALPVARPKVDKHVEITKKTPEHPVQPSQVSLASRLTKQKSAVFKFVEIHQRTLRVILTGVVLTLGMIFIYREFSDRNRHVHTRPERWQPFRSSKPSKDIRAVGSLELVLDAPKQSEETEVKFWRDRALDAELRLEQVSAVARPQLLPHLARVLKDQFVQRLFWQRRALIDTQEMATLKVAELEKRLEQMQASRESQLQAYQLRIEQLEKELTAKTSENRQLIRATMQLTESRLKAHEPL